MVVNRASGTESGLLATLRGFVRIQFLWILPFLSFLLGYQLVRFLSHTEMVEVPPVVGLRMHDAIKNLSLHQLNVRILAEKEEQDLPEGLILSQSPAPGKKVKPHQSIFLVITHQPVKPRAFSFYGLTREEALAQAKRVGIHLTFSELESPHPHGTIIAQSSVPGMELSDKTMAVTVSSGSSTIRLFPDLKGKDLEEVRAFLLPYGIPLFLSPPDVTSGIIIDQRPLAGSLINLKKPPVVHLAIKK